MKILVIGSGGREHALVWKLSQSNRVTKIFVAPGNAGTGQVAENVNIGSEDITGLVKFAREKGIDITFVGPEAPLVKGIVPAFEKEGLRIFGPDTHAARLEGSKVYAKNFMKKYGIPTARYEIFQEAKEALSYIEEAGAPLVVKAEGLAAGKGVVVAESKDEAVNAVEEIMVNKRFGNSGNRIVIEEFLSGQEATVLAFTDGRTIVPMVPSQDHKQAYDNDQGPNTGGMGAYAPAPLVTEKLLDRVYKNILIPTIGGLKQEGIRYKGVLYVGLMVNNCQARVLEYNVRFGDPETQVILPLLKTDLVEIAEAIIDERLDQINIEWSEKKALCVIMASGGYPVKYEKGFEITGLSSAERLDEVKVFQAGTGYDGNRLVTAGGRVLGITALGDSFKQTRKRAYQAVEKIKFSGCHFRTDIGLKAIN